MHQQPQRRRLERPKPQRRQGPRATYQDHASASHAPPARATQGARTDRKTATQPQGPQTGRQRAPRNAAKVHHQPQPTTPPAATETATAGKVCTKASKTAARRATLTTSHNRASGDGGASLANTQGANGPHRTKAGRIPNGRRPAGGVSSPNDLNGWRLIHRAQYK